LESVYVFAGLRLPIFRSLDTCNKVGSTPCDGVVAQG